MAVHEICQEIDPRVVEAAAWHVRNRSLDFMALQQVRRDFATAVLGVINGVHDVNLIVDLPTSGSRIKANNFVTDNASRVLYMPGAKEVNPEDQIWQ